MDLRGTFPVHQQRAGGGHAVRFTRNAKALLLGANLGGLGTPIASLASLISYQFYSKAKRPKPLKYLAVFSAVNFGMLAFLLLIGWLQLGHSISL